MAFDAFIKFGGIEGESNDSEHSGWIDSIPHRNQRRLSTRTNNAAIYLHHRSA